MEKYVSSYTPTLNTLVKASRGIGPARDTPPRLLLIAQPEAPGQRQIQSVHKEVHQIQQIIPLVDVLLERDGIRKEVLSKLTSHHWVHFACHGTQDLQEPFQSRFHLSDEPLSLLDIIRAQMPNAEFAYSAACHSAAGDKNRPDEIIHLAAGLQFSGFRSVIGTLYAMADLDGPSVAQEVYKHMFRRVELQEGTVDFRDAAEALHLATKKLRDSKVPVERWINFIHIGA
ncbi:hypothetical protein FRC03_009034 [Tulasnella sp. 419]|nr:hypothetical protein FRC03_009034 [Tulasnella sp. 419]